MCYCKACNRDRVLQYKKANRERCLEGKRKSHQKHRDKNNARMRAYNKTNKEKISEQRKRHLEENRGVINERQRSLYHAHREKRIDRKRVYNKENRETINEKSRRYRGENSEKLKEYQRLRYQQNRGKVLEANARWSKANRDKVREAGRRYKKVNRHKLLEYQQRPLVKIAINLRTRLNLAIRRGNKAGSAVRDLGCTIDQLRMHIASQFTGCMSWETWGTSFEIDHIFPLAAANLEDRAEFLAVNNWRNLQPLTPAANNAKNNKVTAKARHLFDALVAEFSQQSVA